MTQFERWFKKQFGQLPMANFKRSRMELRLRILKNQSDRLEYKLERDRLTCELLRAACYTKNAAPSGFIF